jgi:phosphoribosylformylglycinamidine (FGAM) synthase-like enzyme
MACYDCAVGFGVPFISGKDSLNNEFNTGREVITIPPTLLISALCVVEDVRQAVTMDLKEPGNCLYLVGVTRPELGGSHYLGLFGLVGQTVPTVDVRRARPIMLAVTRAASLGLVRACHDLSEGGLAVAAAEMAFAGGVGLDVALALVPFEGAEPLHKDPVLLFSESNSRFLLEVAPGDVAELERVMVGVPLARIGTTNRSGRLAVAGVDGSVLCDAPLDRLKAAWQTPLVPH